MLLAGLSCGVVLSVQAQDPHFSQFFSAPLITNPALAGTYDGSFRAGAIYRDQWLSALDDPIRTFLVSGDVTFEVGADTKRVPDKFSAGLSFYNDRVGTFDLNTNQISLYSAYHKVLNERKRHYLGAGLQVGMMQRNVNYEDLTFGDMFNSLDGYTLPSGEILPPNNFGHFDLGIGINYSIAPLKGNRYFFGVGLHHVTGSNVSFYATDNRADDNLKRESSLHQRIAFNAGMSSEVTKFLRFEPRVLYMVQGPHNEVNVGANIRWRVPAADDKYLHFGPYIRATENVSGWGMQSLILAAAYEKGSFILGMSYDQNLRDLVTDRLGLNALEVSITFIGDHNNDTDICPKF